MNIDLQTFLDQIGDQKIGYMDVIKVYLEYIKTIPGTQKIPPMGSYTKPGKYYIGKPASTIPASSKRMLKGNQRAPICWSDLEVTCLINGIKIFGIGKWAEIRDRYQSVFDINDRSRCDIKRKWNNMKKKPEYQYLIEMGNKEEK